MIDWLISYFSALLLHEAGHALATVARGLKVRKIGLCRGGLYIRREAGAPLDNAIIAAAGPAANLLLALSWHWFPQFAEMNALLGLVMLLPLRNSDGTHLIAALAAFLRGAAFLRL